MRKYQQKQILESINTLYEATDEIKRFLSRKDTNSVMQLLADCQEMTIQIGNYIERLEGEGTQTVSRLEEYCQILYQANVEISNNGSDIKIAKPLHKQLIKIENSVKDELKPNKIEIVFISYKASMSDSIESIYLAAKADPCCDAFFIPIPYYNINADNSLGMMHYEGVDCYGNNIEITDWQKYNIEARHPDVIFTFNPYDEGNLVTRVHPDFFCHKLREYTDLLVYVPYFVVSGDVPDHFCTVAGCVYAHKVIVQSEKIRDTYIRVFKRTFGNRFGKAEDKFLALGSPKFDKAFNTKREDCVLPDEWSRLLNGKKVVLYNTSVGAILNGGEQYLKKLRNVLSMFQKRDDVVLWWRPHPLSESTYASMRPGLLEEYRAIVADCKGEIENNSRKIKSNFIYDSSPDMHRAIAMSDCYFGDGSSVVDLYSVTGKPVMIQSTEVWDIDTELRDELLHSDVIAFGMLLLTIKELEVTYPEYYEYWLPFMAKGQSKYVIVPDYNYGISTSLNAIYKLDEENGKVEYWQSFPDDRNEPYLYNAPFRIGNKMIFSPARSRKWAFYDIDNDEWSYEDVPIDLHPTKEYRGVVGGGNIYGDELIFLPGESGAFAKYELNTGKITYYHDWYSKLNLYVENVDWGTLSGMCYYKDSLLFSTVHTNHIFEFNPYTMTLVRIHKVGDDMIGFRHGVVIPNTDIMYLIKYREPAKEPWAETIVKYDISTGKAEEFRDLPVKLKSHSTLNALNHFVFWRNMLYAIPLQGDAVLRLDPKTDIITRTDLIPDFDFYERKNEYYSWARDMAIPYVLLNVKRLNHILQLPYDYSLIDVNFETGEITNRRKWYVDGVEQLYHPSNHPLYSAYIETFNWGINEYIRQIIASEAPKIHFSSNDELAGSRIFSYVKRKLLFGGK